MTHLIVAFGGGTNSTAMLVGLHERGERPDAIWFADTGGEKPYTYTHIQDVSDWCTVVGFPQIEILKGPKVWTPQMVKDGSLEAECLRLGSMPSKAYGFSTCSTKWKMVPADKRLKDYLKTNTLKLTDVVRCIGFDAGEPNRYERALGIMERNPEHVKQRFPLIEWDWDREDCVTAIKRAGLPLPGKSACFFCPSSKKFEIIALKNDFPALMSRALEMERQARAGEGQAPAARGGLGRQVVWGDFLKSLDTEQCSMTNEAIPEMDCGCYD